MLVVTLTTSLLFDPVLRHFNLQNEINGIMHYFIIASELLIIVILSCEYGKYAYILTITSVNLTNKVKRIEAEITDKYGDKIIFQVKDYNINVDTDEYDEELYKN